MDWSNIRMKKVAIMTWYQHKNYGTTLQALALQKVIENLGYSVEGIDYYSKGYFRETFLEKILSKNRLKEGLRNKINRVKYGTVLDDEKDRCYQKFIEDFIAFHTPTQTASQLFCLNDEFDAFVCGSDQIWSPNEFNSKYFLDFVKDDIKKISYAPSFGVNYIENDCVRENIGGLVSKIPHLSVRESRGAKILKEYYGIDAKVVIDPTLLLNAKEWLLYSNKEYKVDSNILLCYFLGENEKVWKDVERIAKLRNLKVAIIPVFSKDYRRKYKILGGVGPAEFITLFSKVSYVCTDSFHGTVFSILFRKEFKTFKRFKDNNPKSQNSRIINLLEKLSLTDHLGNKSNLSKKIDWVKVYSLLDILKKESIDFLNKSLYEASSTVLPPMFL
jgi:Polysaccharide pyruvyl transferase.